MCQVCSVLPIAPSVAFHSSGPITTAKLVYLANVKLPLSLFICGILTTDRLAALNISRANFKSPNELRDKTTIRPWHAED